MKEINLNDDGIMFNKKMKYVQEYWLQECGNEEEVKVSFEHLYNGCLHDADLASKLVALVAARSFTTQEIHNCSLRHQFLTNLQRDFESRCTISSMKYMQICLLQTATNYKLLAH
jgi:hypothetical protein